MLLVYIREAHASDEWPMQWQVEFPQPKSLEDRTQRAMACNEALGLADAGVEVVVDGLDDEFARRFAAWPAACYVVEHGALVFVGQPRDDEVLFDVGLLGAFLA